MKEPSTSNMFKYTEVLKTIVQQDPSIEQKFATVIPLSFAKRSLIGYFYQYKGLMGRPSTGLFKTIRWSLSMFRILQRTSARSIRGRCCLACRW